MSNSKNEVLWILRQFITCLFQALKLWKGYHKIIVAFLI